MKKYVMYFCTTSSYVKSTLCFATADNIEGPYTYVDTILYSGYGKSNISETNLYDVLGKMQIFPDIWNMVDTTIRSGQTVLIRRFLPMQTGGCG